MTINKDTGEIFWSNGQSKLYGDAWRVTLRAVNPVSTRDVELKIFLTPMYECHATKLT